MPRIELERTWQDGAAETTTFVEETFRFLNAPPTWVLALIIAPATVAFAWWSYSGLRRLERPTRVLLSTLRWLAVVLCLLLLFQPAFEVTFVGVPQDSVAEPCYEESQR